VTSALDGPGVRLSAEPLIALRSVALAAAAEDAKAALPGGFTIRKKGHGQEVADIREYVPGDDIRHLDRGASARTGKLHVREFHKELDRVTLLVADFRPWMYWGLQRAFRSVSVGEVLSLLGWNAVASGGRVALLALTGGEPVVIPPRGRIKGMLDVIGGLVEAHDRGLAAVTAGQMPVQPLDAMLSRVPRLVPSGAEIAIASGFDDPGTGLTEQLDALERRRMPRLYCITSADAARLPAGRYPIQMADGRRVRVMLGGDSDASEETRQIAGRTAMVLDASEPVAVTARRLGVALQLERAA